MKTLTWAFEWELTGAMMSRMQVERGKTREGAPQIQSGRDKMSFYIVCYIFCLCSRLQEMWSYI